MVEVVGAALAHARALLASPGPSASDWEEYRSRRDEMFRALEEALPAAAKDPAVARLCAEVLETDRQVAAKIERELANVRRDLAAAADRRRIFNAYVAGRTPRRTFDRRTA
ncbi:MAG TPA: hypothetical protein VNN77_10330 [candidate division Zixibacteria bacterium]|nr:hypothetical protein [candidate division Zixibacteria bacterium]